MKFVAIVCPLGLFKCNFSDDRFLVRPISLFVLKNGWTVSTQRTLSPLGAFQLISLQVCDSQKLFWRLLMVVRSSPHTHRHNPPSPPLQIVQALSAPCCKRHPFCCCLPVMPPWGPLRIPPPGCAHLTPLQLS